MGKITEKEFVAYENELDQDMTCQYDGKPCEKEIYEDGLCEMHFEQSICDHSLETEKMDYGEVKCLSCGYEFGNS